LAGQPSPRNDGKSKRSGKKLKKIPASVNHNCSENVENGEAIYITMEGRGPHHKRTKYHTGNASMDPLPLRLETDESFACVCLSNGHLSSHLKTSHRHYTDTTDNRILWSTTAG
jgi:hypothetical protein